MKAQGGPVEGLSVDAVVFDEYDSTLGRCELTIEQRKQLMEESMRECAEAYAFRPLGIQGEPLVRRVLEQHGAHEIEVWTFGDQPELRTLETRRGKVQRWVWGGVPFRRRRDAAQLALRTKGAITCVFKLGIDVEMVTGSARVVKEGI